MRISPSVDKANYPIHSTHDEAWHPVIQEFKHLIERTPDIYAGFHDMFTQVPPEYTTTPTGSRQVRDYITMLDMFDQIIHQAPEWEYYPNDATANEMVGFPICTNLEWPMGTQAGYAMFTHPLVTAQFKRLFDVWAAYLRTYESTSVLTAAPNGWFSLSAMNAIPHFVDDFLCDPHDPSGHFGFTSWDAYFTRLFRPGRREIEDAFVNDDSVIHSPCESAVYRIEHSVHAYDQFWVKGQPYSIHHMLNHDALAPQFSNGTVLQAYLSPTKYHRWHSPVNGTIVKILNVPGSYFAEAPCEGFEIHSCDNCGARRIKSADILGPNRSQSFLTSVATRCLVFINAKNPHIGLMCFIAVGMVEVSTCEATVRVGDSVKKGDELGMFHYGGSSCCLLFRKGVDVRFDNRVLPSQDQPHPEVRVKERIGQI
ncbi:hypothetical protein ONZ45_g19336 [Pleurotus djamor]|nr:hypothetical protein ONZ45_g19336 [Pleurotus djamor]